MLDKLKSLLPRTWSIWTVAIIAVLFILPVFDLKLVLRFISLFFLFCACGWVVLRVFWTERTKSIEDGRSKSDELRAMVRDACYAIMVTGAIIGASNLSL